MDKLMLSQDKANHAFYGLLIYSIISLISIHLALVVVLIVAIAKEIVDIYTKRYYDYYDILATAIIPIILYCASLVI